MKTALVSRCDANYYPLLRELFASLIQCKKASGIDEARADRRRTLTLNRVEGGEIEKNFRYPDFDKGSLECKRPKRA